MDTKRVALSINALPKKSLSVLKRLVSRSLPREFGSHQSPCHFRTVSSVIVAKMCVSLWPTCFKAQLVSNLIKDEVLNVKIKFAEFNLSTSGSLPSIVKIKKEILKIVISTNITFVL